MVKPRGGRMKFKFEKKYKFDTGCYIQTYAIETFNLYRGELEKLYQSKIRVLRMYRNMLGVFVVEYVLDEEQNNDR